jgi:O-antigen ligase
VATAGVWRRAAAAPWWPELAIAALVIAGLALAVAAPVALLVVGGAALVVAGLVRWPFLIAASLVLLMGNVKVNYYMGFFTFFPEYLVLVVAAGLGFTAWLARPAWPPERRILLAFGVWAFTGILSVPFAMSVARVLPRVVLILTAMATWLAIVATVDTRPRLLRAVALWEIAATAYAIFGIVQMIGLVAGFDTSMPFLAHYSNPDLFVGIGAPVRRRIGDVFRANSMFNDPNILAGFLAAAMTAVLVLQQHHAELGRRARAAAERVALLLMGVCLMLTQSRSGVLAFVAGAGVVFAQRPRMLGKAGLWLVAGAAVAAIVGVMMALGVDPTLLVARLAGIGDTNDSSNRQHLDAFLYGLRLIARYPLTGVGLGNFGLYYGAEWDAYYAKMMSHSAPITYFAESGIPGGLAFLAVWWLVLRRAWRGEPPASDATARTLRLALCASLVALLAANLFYDYIARTFVWVIAGLAVCAARLRESAPGPVRPA